MTKLAHRAAAEGAEWILPFDADELWYARGNEGSLCSQIRKTSEQIINGVVWHRTPISEPTTQGAIVDMVWRREAPERFPVAAYRYHPAAVVMQGNHWINYPDGGVISDDFFEVKHYQYRSFVQFRKKVDNGKTAYEATSLAPGEGEHWRSYGALP